jgi:hypothetical protein
MLLDLMYRGDYVLSTLRMRVLYVNFWEETLHTMYFAPHLFKYFRAMNL